LLKIATIYSQVISTKNGSQKRTKVSGTFHLPFKSTSVYFWLRLLFPRRHESLFSIYLCIIFFDMENYTWEYHFGADNSLTKWTQLLTHCTSPSSHYQQVLYDTIRYIYVRSKTDKMASLVYCTEHKQNKITEKLETKTSAQKKRCRHKSV